MRIGAFLPFSERRMYKAFQLAVIDDAP
jgi:hypothetical protein